MCCGATGAETRDGSRSTAGRRGGHAPRGHARHGDGALSREAVSAQPAEWTRHAANDDPIRERTAHALITGTETAQMPPLELDAQLVTFQKVLPLLELLLKRPIEPVA